MFQILNTHVRPHRVTDDGSYNVLLVLPALDAGGVELSVVDIAEHLIAQGHGVHIVSAGGRLVPQLTAMGARHYTMPVGSKNPLNLPWRIAALRRLIVHCNADIVHAHSRACAWPAWRAAMAQGVPFVTTYHGIYNEGWPGKRLYNSIMARGDHVIANSAFTAAHIMKTHGTAQDRITVILRGVDMQAFDPAAISAKRRAAMREKWSVSDDQRVIMLPARLTRWKGQITAIEALSQLPEEYVLVCVGDAQGRDDYAAEIWSHADGLGVRDRVRLPGHETDMPAANAAADLVITPSLDPEAFGKTATEAQAMGRWVIASAHGGALETIEDGETGTLFPPGDVNALAQAILSAPASFDADYMRDRIDEQFSKTALQAAVLQVYASLLPDFTSKTA